MHVFSDRGAEDDRRDVVETVDPLAALVSLSAHIEELEFKVFKIEIRLDDARRSNSASQDVLFGRFVARCQDSIDILKETAFKNNKRVNFAENDSDKGKKIVLFRGIV